MHFSWTTLLLLICFSGIQCLSLPFPSDEEIDNISDSSDDIIITRPPVILSEEEKEPDQLTKAPVKNDIQMQAKSPEPCSDPKVYGMNIGLHYILEDISKRMTYGDRVHLESLIKVLVLTHKIEKAGGSLEENNQKSLTEVAKLYPKALRKAMKS